MSFSKNLFFLLFVSLGLIWTCTVQASPSLMLYPTRVVFEKNQRAFQVDLTNTGTSPGTYRISLENKRMTPNGSFVSIDSPIPGELTADKIIQYSPRQVVIAPGSGQTIRIIVRKPADLPPGEYRSHLVFTRLPDVSTNTITKGNSEASITMTPLIGASIPIIVQNGATFATAVLTNLKFTKATATEEASVAFDIERSGNKSVYGNLSAFFKPSIGDEQEISIVKGIALYSPYTVRSAKMSLTNEKKITLGNGKLIVRYTEPPASGGKLISEKSIDIP